MGYHIIDDHPDDPRHLIPYVEFYVTNVCNLTCQNCNRFNNHNFRGWQRWSDYEAQYEAWSKNVRLQKVAILGGEPLLNPTILDWARGINRIWKKTVQIQTNGTRLNHVPGLYELLLEDNIDTVSPWARNWIGVSLHNQDDRDALYDTIYKFLKHPVTVVEQSDPRNADNSYTWGAALAFIDSNQVKIPVWTYDSFYDAAVRIDDQGRYTVFDNDPIAAHDGCGFARYKCYHFVKGGLYKCGPVALLPEFDQQLSLHLSSQDQELLHSYKPLRADEWEQRGAKFMATLDDPIPQCKFCPITSQNITIKAVNKKPGSVSGFS